MALIEQRHARLGRLLQVWDAHRRGFALPPARALDPANLADLAPLTVFLVLSGEDGSALTIASSGSEVDALYGTPLAGASARDLAPVRGDAEQEARSAMETARPVLIEDEIRCEGRRQRVARLYLPLADDDGTPCGVLCGVVAVL